MQFFLDRCRGTARVYTRVLRKLFPIGLCLAGFAYAEEEAPAENRSAEALEILKKADAIKAVDAVRYKVTTTPSGIALNFVRPAQGEAVLVGWNGSIPEKFYSHVRTQEPDSGEELELTGGGDGESFFIINHKTKKAYEDMDPAVMGSGANTLRVVSMLEFVHDAPFDDKMNGDYPEKFELRPPRPRGATPDAH